MKKILKMVMLVILTSTFAAQTEAKEKEIRYNKDGLNFVVGKHEPEKRVNPEKKEKIITKEIVIEKIRSNGIEEKEIDENEENKIKLFQEGNGQNKNVDTILHNEPQDIPEEGFLSIVAGAIKEVWHKITLLEENLKKLVFKVDKIESVMDAKEDESKNVKELIELTSQITEEIKDQEGRIVELEKDKKNNSDDIEMENE